MLGGSGFESRFFQSKLTHVDIEFINIFLGNDFEIHSLLIGTFDDFVINVSKVSNKSYIVSSVFEVTVDRIKDNGRSRVADMAEVIDRHPADVHPNPFFMEWDEFFFLTC